MGVKDQWHDDDAFWVKLAPFVFSEDRWANTPAEVDHLLNLIGLRPGKDILDIGCGPGRFSLELARRGYKVTGIDRTEPYLTTARDKALSEGLHVNFLKSDMRKFVQTKSFDCALSMYTSFGYFKDPAENLQVLENAHKSLKDPGLLVIEVMGKEVLARIFTERNWDQVDQAFLLQERGVSENWSRVDNRWILIDGVERWEFEVQHWIYSAAEFKQMLLNVGFSSVDVYGSLAGTPYNHEANRLIILAHKAKQPANPKM